MTVHETGSAVRLLAQTAEGIRGESEPVEVQTTNDLVLAAVDFPDPIEIGALLQLGLTVNNSGPGAATGVILTNVLPPGLTYVRATPSQGACALVNGAVRCDLGVLPGGSAATINLELVPNQAGYITNVAEVFGDGEELYAANNRATTVTRVNFATLSLDSVTVAEGNTSGVTVDLPVRLHGL